MKGRASRNPGVGSSVTPEEWQRIWSSQGGLCLVCLHPLRNRYLPRPGDSDTRRVAGLDHDHELESRLKRQGVDAATALRRSLRGLLCNFPCNRLLVRFWTSQRLDNAARYVRSAPAQRVLA